MGSDHTETGGSPAVKVRRVKLDVLKPHHPNALEFATGLAAATPGCSVDVRVLEMDEKTETLEVLIQGEDVGLERLSERIAALGGSLHSIDEVTVSSVPGTDGG